MIELYTIEEYLTLDLYGRDRRISLFRNKAIYVEDVGVEYHEIL